MPMSNGGFDNFIIENQKSGFQALKNLKQKTWSLDCQLELFFQVPAQHIILQK